MGWWKIQYWKRDAEGSEVELEDADLEEIAKKVKEGYKEGQVIDKP